MASLTVRYKVVAKKRALEIDDLCKDGPAVQAAVADEAGVANNVPLEVGKIFCLYDVEKLEPTADTVKTLV